MRLKVKILGSGNAAQKHRAAYETLSDLYELVDDGADIVDICTPPYLHFSQARDALLSGAHAIVEKPVCGSLAECDELAKLEHSTGKFVVPVFQYRFGWPYVETAYHWRRNQNYYAGWRGKWETALGGVLTSHAIHMLDWYPDVAAVTATLGRTAFTSCDVENFAHVVLERPLQPLHLSFAINPSEDRSALQTPPHAAAGYLEFFRRAHAGLTTDAPLPVTLAEARRSLELLTACYYSAFTGERVTLPLGPEHPFFEGWSQHFAPRSPQPVFSQKTPGSPERPSPQQGSGAHP